MSATPPDGDAEPGTPGLAFGLPSVASSVAQARRRVIALCRSAGGDAHCDTAALLVSEVVTNAVVHGTGEVEVRATLSGARLRVEVCDGSSTLPRAAHRGAEAESGRGVLLVEAMADAWGAEPVTGGKRVWFELDCSRA